MGNLKENLLNWAIGLSAPLAFFTSIVAVSANAMGISLPLDFLFGGTVSATGNLFAVFLAYLSAGFIFYFAVGTIYEIVLRKLWAMLSLDKMLKKLHNTLPLSAGVITVYLMVALLSGSFMLGSFVLLSAVVALGMFAYYEVYKIAGLGKFPVEG